MLPLIVWYVEERKREKQKTAGAVERDSPRWICRNPLKSVSEQQQVEPGLASAEVLVQSETGDCSDQRGQSLLNRFRSGRALGPHSHRQRSAREDETERRQRKYLIAAGGGRRYEGKIQRPACECRDAEQAYDAACYDGHSLEEADQRAVAARRAECNYAGIGHVTSRPKNLFANAGECNSTRRSFYDPRRRYVLDSCLSYPTRVDRVHMTAHQIPR